MGDEIQTFTCEICTEPALLDNKFRHDNSSVHNICLTCIARYIQTKINENICNISCPDQNCEETLIPLECQPMISSALFVKWCDCLCRWSISAKTSCYCPYRDCSELILNECNEAMTRFVCPGCKRLVCYACGVPWHAGFRCRESSQERDANDVEFGKLIEKNKWTRCPGCGHPIERIKGCDQVRCRCGTRFCHLCGSRHLLPGCEIRSTPMIILRIVRMIICSVSIVLLVHYGTKFYFAGLDR